MGQNYDQFYQWLPSGHTMTEQQARIATQVLHRIPIQDLAELQSSRTKIDAKYCGLFRIGQAEVEEREGQSCVVCSVCPDVPDEVFAGVLAHELAHARLKHCTKFIPKEMGEANLKALDQVQEEEAQTLAERWGFRAELQAANAYFQRRQQFIVERADLFRVE